MFVLIEEQLKCSNPKSTTTNSTMKRPGLKTTVSSTSGEEDDDDDDKNIKHHQGRQRPEDMVSIASEGRLRAAVANRFCAADNNPTNYGTVRRPLTALASQWNSVETATERDVLDFSMDSRLNESAEDGKEEVCVELPLSF